MYEAYWQLETKPFSPLGGSDAAYFESETHTGALLKLRYALQQRRAAAVLAGPSGVGKTLLASRLIEDLDAATTAAVRVVFPLMNDRDLLSYLASRLGAVEAGAATDRFTIDQSIERIERRFAENHQDGRHTLLVIDEAHLLEDTGLLETVRLLLNLGATATPPMTLLLVGQMGLLSALGRTPGLEERVAVKSLLRPFTVAETADYVRHRMTVAGAAREVFTDAAFEMMHALTGGVARRVDRLCDLALVVGFADGRPTIDAEHIEAVSRELLTVTPE